MKVRILALVSLLAIGTSVANAQAPAKDRDKDKDKDKSSEVKGDKHKWDKDHKKGEDDDRDDRDGRKGGEWGAQRRLLGGIQLTDAQKASIKAIHARYEPRMDAVRDSMKANRKAGVKPAAGDPLRAHARALAMQERAEIRAVLTAQQQVRFDQNVAKFDGRMKERGKRGDRGDSR